MMEFTVSKNPIRNNANCAYCGRVFNEGGLSLQIRMDHREIDFPLCQRCFDMVPIFEAAVNPETGYARLKR